MLSSGLSATQAYGKAGYKARDGNAARLAGNARVKAGVAEFQGKAEAATVLTILEKRAFLAHVVHAHGAGLDLKEDSDLEKRREDRQARAENVPPA